MNGYKYKFTTDCGKIMVITRDNKMSTKQVRDYKALMGDGCTFTEEALGNDKARPIKFEHCGGDCGDCGEECEK